MRRFTVHLFGNRELKQRRLFPFRKRSLPFLMIKATIGNQAFSHDGCNIHFRLSYKKANNTFVNSLEKNDLEAQVEITLKVMERSRVTTYWCISYER